MSMKDRKDSSGTSRNHIHKEQKAAGTKMANIFIKREFGKAIAKAEGYWGNSWYHTGALTKAL